MLHTVRFQRILERAEELAKEAGLDCIDSYCVSKAMLDGSIYNMLYIACLNLGVNMDNLIIELDRINAMRGPYTQAGGPHELTKPFIPPKTE